MDSNTYAAIKAAQSGDKVALERLTKDNTPLIWSIISRFRGRGTEDEDLFQLGAIGFIKAVRGFDTERGLELSTYAVPMIMGEVRRHLRDGGMIRVSRSIKELAYRVQAAARTLAEEAGQEVPLSKIADHLGVTTEEVAMAIGAVQEPDSLQRPIGAGEGILSDIIEGSEDIAEKTAERVTLMRLLDTGNPIEKDVILCRYFRDKTQSETARLLGLSQVQVSRMEKRAIARLRNLMDAGTAGQEKCL